MMSDGLVIRNNSKKKKPIFQRQDANKYKQFRKSWRRPRGIHSKLKTGFKGHGAVPSIGYGTPKLIKGLTKDGLRRVLVNNLNDLQKINEKNIAVIGACVGVKKRLDILKAAKEKKLKVAGVKDFDSSINKITGNLKFMKSKSVGEKKDESKK